MIELPFMVFDEGGFPIVEHHESDVRAARALLRRSRWLIATPTTWCRDTYAVDGAGKTALVGHGVAHSWCALGAVYETGGCPPSPDIYDRPAALAVEALNEAVGELYGDQLWANVPSINDNLGHAAVMRVYARAEDILLEALEGERR